MTSLEQKLKEATKEETEFAVESDVTSIARLLAQRKYKLFLGEQFGENRNQYWFDSNSGKYFIDYTHNLMHIVGNSLSVLSQLKIPFESREQTQHIEKLVLSYMENLQLHLKENLLMYESRKIDLAGQTLNVPNEEVYNDIFELKMRVDMLASSKIGTRRFIAKSGALINFYKEKIMNKYMRYNQLLKQNSTTY